MKTQEEHQLRTLQEAVRASFISQGDLWQTYSRLGGIAGHVEVEAHICGLVPLPSEERDLLATAANDAKKLGDLRAISYAKSTLGELYEITWQISEAKQLTSRGLSKLERKT